MSDMGFLLLGVGRSSYAAIEYLAHYCIKNNTKLTVADAYIRAGLKKEFEQVEFVLLDIGQTDKLAAYIQNARVIISLLPPDLHIRVALQCVYFRRNLITASYLSAEMEALHPQALASNLLFLGECGLDPGLDHMSIMDELDTLKASGAQIIGLKSYCGGLASLASAASNPWQYKISWNPRNIVLAGEGTALYLDQNGLCLLPKHHLFAYPQNVDLGPVGQWEAYPNRNSLTYTHDYGLENAHTLIRSTLRPIGFCRAWNILIQIGFTQDDTIIPITPNYTWQDFARAFLPPNFKNQNPKQAWQKILTIDAPTMQKLDFLGVFEPEPISWPCENATPARLLQTLLEDKWKLSPTDTDMILMSHEFEYLPPHSPKNHKIQTCLMLEGQNQHQTAMAKTVGLPLAMAACLIAENKISLKGVCRPTYPQIYKPLLAELQAQGIYFTKRQLEN